MLLFFNSFLGVKAVPTEKIYSVEQFGEKISISYDAGEITYLENGEVVKKIEIAELEYDTTEFADLVMKDFYSAASSGSQAFDFSNVRENESEDTEIWF